MKKTLLLIFILSSVITQAQTLRFNRLYQPIDSISEYTGRTIFNINDTLYSLSSCYDINGLGIMFNSFDKDGNLLITKTLKGRYKMYYSNGGAQACLSPKKDKILIFTTYSDSSYTYHYGEPNSWGDEYYECDAILIAFDLKGDTVFTKKYNHGIFDVGGLVMPSGNNKYILASEFSNDTLEGNTNSYTRITMVDTLGNELWTNTYLPGNISRPNSITQTPDGDFCIAVDHRAEYVIWKQKNKHIKVDSTGILKWSKTIATNYDEYNPEVASLHSGNVVFASPKCIAWGNNDGKYRLRMRMLSKASGDMFWEKLYGDTMNLEQQEFVDVKDIRILDNDDILVTGTTYSPEYKIHYSTDIITGDTISTTKERFSRAFLLKTDSLGNQKFMKYYTTVDTTDYHWINSIELAPDNGYILYGNAYDDGYSQEFHEQLYEPSNNPWMLKTDENGCIDMSCVNSIEEIDEEDYHLFLYPNPAQDQLFIDLPINQHSAQLTFYNLSGAVIAKKQVYTSAHQAIDISDIPNGMYILEVINNNKLLGRNKLVVIR